MAKISAKTAKSFHEDVKAVWNKADSFLDDYRYESRDADCIAVNVKLYGMKYDVEDAIKKLARAKKLDKRTVEYIESELDNDWAGRQYDSWLEFQREDVEMPLENFIKDGTLNKKEIGFAGQMGGHLCLADVGDIVSSMEDIDSSLDTYFTKEGEYAGEDYYDTFKEFMDSEGADLLSNAEGLSERIDGLQKAVNFVEKAKKGLPDMWEEELDYRVGEWYDNEFDKEEVGRYHEAQEKEEKEKLTAEVYAEAHPPFPKNKVLVIIDDLGNKHYVNYLGYISQAHIKSFSPTWKLRAIVQPDLDDHQIAAFTYLNEKEIERIKKMLRDKEGNLKLSVADIDHNTWRVWGRRIKNMYFADASKMADGGAVEGKLEAIYKKYSEKDYWGYKNEIDKQAQAWRLGKERGQAWADKFESEADFRAHYKKKERDGFDWLVNKTRQMISEGDVKELKSRVRYDQKVSLEIYEVLTGESLKGMNNKQLAEYFEKKYGSKMAGGGALSYKEATKIPKMGAKYANIHNERAWVSDIIAKRHALRPEAVYNWMEKHKIDPLKSYILYNVKYNNEFLDDILNDKYESTKKIINKYTKMSDGGRAGLKKEVDDTLEWMAKTDLNLYGGLTEETKKAFETQKVAIPEWAKKGTMAKGGKIKYPKERLEVAEQSEGERQLELFMDNDGDLYRQQVTPIRKNLMTKLGQGKFDINLAPKIYIYLIDNGQKKFMQQVEDYKEYGIPLTRAQKENLAKEYVNRFLNEAELGNYDNYLPKKYQTEKSQMAGGGKVKGDWIIKVFNSQDKKIGEKVYRGVTKEQAFNQFAPVLESRADIARYEIIPSTVLDKKTWIVHVMLPYAKGKVKKEIVMGRLSDKFDVKQEIERRKHGGDKDFREGQILAIEEKMEAGGSTPSSGISWIITGHYI